MANKNVSLIGIGIVLVVISLLIGIVSLEPLNEGVADYADGPDDTAGNTDDPPQRDVTLLQLTPFVLIAAMLISGVAVLVVGARGLAA